ncbi:TrkA C-terminal domain-containing protein, partial [Acinetobacter baumannii]
TLGAESRAAGRLLAQAALPDGAVVAMITRDKSITPPRGSTRLLAGDHLFVVMRPELRPFVDCALANAGGRPAELPETVLRLKGATTVE